MNGERLNHEFPPVYDRNSRVLILGSFPSVKSREARFYYGHPQNRFWRVISVLTGEEALGTVEEKREILLRHGIALWDVIASCRIRGSSDSSIREAEVNDFTEIFRTAPDIRVFANGTKAYELYHRYALPRTGREIGKLPSTSPANAAWTLEALCAEWGRLLSPLNRRTG